MSEALVYQGRLYRHGLRDVIAMESGEGEVRVKVLPIDPEHVAGVGRIFKTHARSLVPLPMKYYGNAIPGSES